MNVGIFSSDLYFSSLLTLAFQNINVLLIKSHTFNSRISDIEFRLSYQKYLHYFFILKFRHFLQQVLINF
jgi:hypothetical protein